MGKYALPKHTFDIVLNSMHCHIPLITLDRKISMLIKNLKKFGAVVSILSDGRSITQRAKIHSLKLNWVDAILISEEIGDRKPSQKVIKYYKINFPGQKITTSEIIQRKIFMPQTH